MKEYILITGASSGIGYEMSKLLAAKGYNLVLVARNILRMNELKQELEMKFGVEVICIQKDLSHSGAAAALYEQVKTHGIPVSMLVNNAGFGIYGAFVDTSLEEELNMLRLNIESVVVLTKLFAKDMAANKKGRIMNIASLLSFLPFPYYSVYSATKSFVLSFTETIAAELEDSGVIVTALCPGPVDTNFTTADMLATNAYKTNKPVSPVKVAQAGVDLLLNGKGKKIVGFSNWFISNLPRVTPDKIMMRIKKKLASKPA